MAIVNLTPLGSISDQDEFKMLKNPLLKLKN